MNNRVAPVLKEATDAGTINLTAIVNTHQCVVRAASPKQGCADKHFIATGTMPEVTRDW
jgi:hypothetical protein